MRELYEYCAEKTTDEGEKQKYKEMSKQYQGNRNVMQNFYAYGGYRQVQRIAYAPVMAPTYMMSNGAMFRPMGMAYGCRPMMYPGVRPMGPILYPQARPMMVAPRYMTPMMQPGMQLVRPEPYYR